MKPSLYLTKPYYGVQHVGQAFCQRWCTIITLSKVTVLEFHRPIESREEDPRDRLFKSPELAMKAAVRWITQ